MGCIVLIIFLACLIGLAAIFPFLWLVYIAMACWVWFELKIS